MTVKLISITPNAENIIEEAGRTCYMSKVGNPAIIKKWIKSGHESVLEHGSATFRINCSRACSHQLVRHRTGKFSQRSQRYVKEDNFYDNYVMPKNIEKDEYEKLLFEDVMSKIMESYSALLEMGVKKEDARYVLPNATGTEIVVTFDFRNLRHFLKLRLHKSAQWEIREIAENILGIMQKKCPNVFNDLKEC